MMEGGPAHCLAPHPSSSPKSEILKLPRKPAPHSERKEEREELSGPRRRAEALPRGDAQLRTLPRQEAASCLRPPPLLHRPKA